jgi:hypothetical protein
VARYAPSELDFGGAYAAGEVRFWRFCQAVYLLFRSPIVSPDCLSHISFPTSRTQASHANLP